MKILEKQRQEAAQLGGEADHCADELSISQQESYKTLFGRKMHKSTMKKAEKALKIMEQIRDQTGACDDTNPQVLSL